MSVQYLTRAAIRDATRRAIGQTPPIDLGTGAVGDQPTNYRDPTNPALNQYIDEVLAEFNREVSISSAPSPIMGSIPAQIVNGPYGFNLAAGFNSNQGVNNLRHVWWLPTGSASAFPLIWSSYDEQNRQNPNWINQPPGTPTTCWMEGYQLKILPAPAMAGTIYATATLCFNSPRQDSDIIGILPSDYYPCVVDQVVLRVAQAQSDDTVRQAQMQMTAPRAALSRGQLIKWINTRNGESSGYVPGLKFKNNLGIVVGRYR